MGREKYCYELGYRVMENGNIISKSGSILSGSINNGYIRISIRSYIYSYFFAHRLQAYQKYGDALFKEGIEVRHKNGNSYDNSYDNILIGSHSENMMDIPQSIRVSRAIHASSFNKKYCREDVIDFHENNSRSYKKTMERFGISSKGTLHFILNGKSYKG